ncbi:MAG TPA: hypothetical protein VES59_10005 [Bacteroidota bacterium]|nr:hypothetical protein [Bacteroidota bacterium]
MKKIIFLLLLAIPSAVLFPQSVSYNLSHIHGITLIVPGAGLIAYNLRARTQPRNHH